MRERALVATVALSLLCLVAGRTDAEPIANTTPIRIPGPPPPPGCPTLTNPNSCPPTKAIPYPSPITVADLPGTISDVNVTLRGLTHESPNDLDVMLHAPNGTTVMLMSDACAVENDDNPIATPVDLTFDDAAAAPLPINTACSSGTFRPVDDDNDDYFFLTQNEQFQDATAAPPPGALPLSTLNGGHPNGTWRLWVVDDWPGTIGVDSGQFAGGWSLDLTVTGLPTTSSTTTTTVLPDENRPAGDYDGDEDADLAVFRPSSGIWFVEGGATTAWGTTGDIPVPADYDGDGDTDEAVFRPSSGVWFVDGGAPTAWGAEGDIPVPADYDGDGDADVAVFRPSSGVWFVEGGPTTAWGTSGDIPVPADYDGDGNAEVAVYRPASGTWFVEGGTTTAWGTSGDIPVPADYGGDGDADIAVFRPSSGIWFVEGGATTAWGISGDIPVPADYDGDGDAELAVFRPSTGTWFIESRAPNAWGAGEDVPLPLPDAIQRFFF